MLRLIRQSRERACIIVSIQESRLNGNKEIQDILVAFAGDGAAVTRAPLGSHQGGP
jgi:hypothetical protein